MTSKLDLSLDDIISSRPKFSGNGNSGGARRRGPNPNRSDRRGGRPNKSTPYARRSGSPSRAQGITEVGKILVSNLHYGVSEHDLKELFSQVGHVRTATLNFDSRGASQGSGIVIFSRGPDALKAVKQFNGVTLDNRPMRIAIPVTPDTNANKPVSSRVGPTNVSSGRNQRSSGSVRNNGGRRGGNRRNKSEPRPAKTVDELDAELDAYLAAPEDSTVAMEE